MFKEILSGIIYIMDIKYNEVFNLRKAQFIIENYEEVKKQFRKESEERLNNINLDPLTLFKKYVSNSKKLNISTIPNTNIINVSYKQNNNIGRYFAKGSLSLQTLPREIRQTIASDYYYDIDIKNCHPVLLKQYAKANKLTCNYIKLYIKHRDDLLKEYATLYKVNKDAVKKSFLSILNGGKTFLNMKGTEMPQFVQEFKNEVINIQHYIFENEPIYKKLGIANAKKKQEANNYKTSNELGSTMNIMLCDIENKILQSMIKYLINNGIIEDDIIVMVFDGLMIPKTLKLGTIDEILAALERVVYEEVDYKINLDVKPMEDIINVPNDYKIRPNKNKKELYVEDYDKMKKDFEQNVFKILRPISYGIIDNTGEFYKPLSRQQLIDTYENLLITKIKKSKSEKHEDEKIEVLFVKEWLRDKEIRTYDKIDFLPMIEAPPNIFNIFNGYQIEKETIKFDETLNVEDSYIYKHIKTILCNNNDDIFNYFTNVLSRLLKDPSNLTRTAEIFKSVQGTGKDIFFDWLGKDILGHKYYIKTDKPEKIFGRFNTSLEYKILLVINETNGKDTYSLNENIKAIITDTSYQIERKGDDPYELTNCTHLCFLTNNENSIKIEPNERRMAAFECYNKLANNKIYFDNLVDEIKTKKYNMCLYKWLMSIDSDEYNFSHNRPKTDFYNSMQEMNIPPLALFLKLLVIKKVDKYNASILFKLFNNYLEKYNFNIKYTITTFGRDINKYEGIEKTKSNLVYYIFDNTKLKEYLTNTYKFEFFEDSNEDDIEFLEDDII